MSTKLTLTLDDSIINKAKQFAKKKGSSLSKIIENYLKILTNEKDSSVSEIKLSPLVKTLKGSFKAPVELDYKEELAKGLSKKYL